MCLPFLETGPEALCFRVVRPSVRVCACVQFDAFSDRLTVIDITIIIFIYRTRTEHKIQKLNSVHYSMEGYRRSYSYANQTKLFNMNCNNNISTRQQLKSNRKN